MAARSLFRSRPFPPPRLRSGPARPGPARRRWVGVALAVGAAAVAAPLPAAAQSQPPRLKAEPIPLSSQNRSIASIEASAPRASRSASASPQSLRRVPNFDHQLITKPPLRPLAPLPQRSASTIATVSPG